MPRPGWLAAFQPQTPSLWGKRNTPKRIQTHHTDVKTSSLLPESNICTEKLAETKAKKDKPNTALFKTCELVLQPRTIIPCHIETTQGQKATNERHFAFISGCLAEGRDSGCVVADANFQISQQPAHIFSDVLGQVVSFPV